MNTIHLLSDGSWTIGEDEPDSILQIQAVTHSYLADAELEIGVFSNVKNPESLEDISLQLRWVDTANADEIYKVKGMIESNPEYLESIVAVADATAKFEIFELIPGVPDSELIEALQQSEAFNAYNGLQRSRAYVTWPDDAVPAFEADDLFNHITTMVDTPSYLVLPVTTNLELFVTMLRAAEKLDIPLDCELPGELTIEQAAQMAMQIEADSHQVQLIWSPNLCRPRDAKSVNGRKVPHYGIGQHIGDKLMRNVKKDAEGYAPIHRAVAWEDYAYSSKGMELRPGIVFDEQAIKLLAKSKVNVVRPIKFNSVKFVLSDVLTQKISENSALRLIPAAEIAMRTKSECIRILKRHMLKPMTEYIKEANKEIEKYLSGAATAGWLKPAEDLGGKPYEFKLTPDKEKPFERVRLYLARRPEGTTRSVIFDDDVLVK
ncbi:hypothetical protein [Acinetobacter chinensis]|uniref:hypothetical protein n=1 Tax=Acinetobacter chinensis TaxID=2004650 RepID=UPI002934432B|nr:hypothetical protein [Acinetobacter chinensis]WOE40057.1 hypothetical protein QSG87_09035 [Acinetobacter chinensis]